MKNNRGTSWSMFFLGAAFSFFFFLESSSRWGEMSIYVLANWFESMKTNLSKQKKLPYIPHFDVNFFIFNLLLENDACSGDWNYELLLF